MSQRGEITRTAVVQREETDSKREQVFHVKGPNTEDKRKEDWWPRYLGRYNPKGF